MAILLRLTFAALVLLVVEYSGFWVWLISRMRWFQPIDLMYS